jgi:uncharacterized membrane protein
VDAAADAGARLARLGLSWPLWAVLAAVFGGSAIWFGLARDERLRWLDTNDVPHEAQLRALLTVGIVFGAIGLAIAVAAIAGRLLERRWSLAAAGRRVTSWAAFALAAPLLLALSKKGIEKTTPRMTLVLAGLAGLAAGWAAYRATRPAALLPSPREDAADGRQTRASLAADLLAWLAVFGLWAAYAWFFTDLSITNHHALVTRTTDLGYYDNIFWQSIHGRPLGCSFIKAGYHGSAHFDPILVVLSPLYLLYPRAELLLGLQSVWCGAGVVPAYLIGRRQLGSRWAGVALALCYALHPAVHGANMYEFHSLTLATVPILFALHSFQCRAWKSYAVAVFVALLVREDVALMMMGVGLWGLLHPTRAERRAGALTIAGSAAYFGVVKAFFMTSAGLLMSGKEAYSFAYYYADLIPNKKGTGGLLLSLFTNPVFVLNHVLTEEKVLFLATVFLPLAMLPFFARRDRVLLLYGLLFILLASRTAVYSTHFQYTASILPFAFAVAPVAIRRAGEARATIELGLDGRRLRVGLVVGMLVAAAAVSWKFGGIVPNDVFKGGFYRVDRELSDKQRETHAWVREMVDQIPPGSSVGVSNKLGPHASGRRHAYFYGQKRTEYVFVDEKELKSDRSKSHKKAIAEGRLVEIGRHGTMALFRATNFDRNLKDTEMHEADVDLEQHEGDADE